MTIVESLATIQSPVSDLDLIQYTTIGL